MENYLISYNGCFGAMAGYVDGKIFCSLGKFGFVLKLPPSELENLIKIDCKPLKYFKKGHIKRDYAVISQVILEINQK